MARQDQTTDGPGRTSGPTRVGASAGGTKPRTLKTRVGGLELLVSQDRGGTTL